MLIWPIKAEYYKTYFFSCIKMGKEILTSGNIEIEKKKKKKLSSQDSYFFGILRYWKSISI